MAEEEKKEEGKKRGEESERRFIRKGVVEVEKKRQRIGQRGGKEEGRSGRRIRN